MKLDDLSADELARIDSVCLEFEKRLGGDPPLTVDDAVRLYLDDTPTDDEVQHRVAILREELVAIETELSQRRDAPSHRSPVPQPWAQPISDAGTLSPGQPFRSKVEHYEGSEDTASRRADSSTARPRSAATDADGEVTQWAPTLDSEQRPTSNSASDNASAKPNPPPQNHPAQTPREPRTPRAIGPYAIKSVLGRGGMGVVYRADDTRLDRPVAIKMMGFPNLAPTDPKRIELVDRFEREARAVAALSHANIVELFDVGVTGDAPFAVMEYLDGVTLANELTAGPKTAEMTVLIGSQIASALATAHAAGVVHRDLKPQNVMLVHQRDSGAENVPRIKLVDFGLSRVSDSTAPTADDDSNGTKSGMILGTPGYMAPEQARGEPATSAADMFGLGCVLYETFYGKPAIPGQTPADRLAETLTGNVEYDRRQCEKSRVLCQLISECLQKEPDKRPTAKDVHARLRKLELNPNEAGAGDEHCMVSKGKRMVRRNAMSAIAGGLAGAVVGGVSFSRTQRPLDSIRSLAVLTLRDAGASSSTRLPPLEDRMITEGETLSSALVNELSLVDGLMVLPYSPQSAETPDEFRALGRELEVDAFLTGSYEYQKLGAQRFWVLHWQLVSARDGSVLYGEQFVTEHPGENSGGQFLTQSQAASDVAKRIGMALVTSGQSINPPNAMSYGCMMKGRAYADPDSVKSLVMSLKCFNKAHEEDPRRSEPLAAIAVTSLDLAARSEPDESLTYLETARDSISQALQLDPSSKDARLAEAMFEWQSLHHYETAFELLEQLAAQEKFNWKIQHQRGLLLAAMGNESAAIDALNSATKFNPKSYLVKTDLSRVEWFFHYQSPLQTERIVRDTRRHRDSLPNQHAARDLAVGLLTDIFEQQGDLQRASNQWSSQPFSGNADSYYAKRQAERPEFAYGPFGSLLNRTIAEIRSGKELGNEIFGPLDDSGATMFPLLLARHPAFAVLRTDPEAERYLPRRT